MNLSEIAVSQFKTGLSCPQSLVAAFADSLGFDMDAAIRIATGFGGGIGRTGELCGAVSGAILVLGMKYGGDEPENRDKTIACVRQFTSRFLAQNPSLRCKELLGCDIGTPEGWDAAKQGSLFSTVCPKFIHDAAEILESMLRQP